LSGRQAFAIPLVHPPLPHFFDRHRIPGRMSKLDYRNIEKVPGRCGGRAVVASTRIRVSAILTCY